MPNFTIPIHALREDNDCHLPAGTPEGGRFCSKRGAVQPVLVTHGGRRRVYASATIRPKTQTWTAKEWERYRRGLQIPPMVR